MSRRGSRGGRGARAGRREEIGEGAGRERVARARFNQVAQEAMDRGRRGQAKRRLRVSRRLGDEDADVAVAQADEHVLVGEVVTDDEHRWTPSARGGEATRARCLCARPWRASSISTPGSRSRWRWVSSHSSTMTSATAMIASCCSADTCLQWRQTEHDLRSISAPVNRCVSAVNDAAISSSSASGAIAASHAPSAKRHTPCSAANATRGNRPTRSETTSVAVP